MIRTNNNSLGMEIGLIAGLLILNLLFQFVPGSELGRLATRTLDNTMEAVDAFLPYDATVKEDEIIKEDEVIQVEIEQIVQDVPNEVVISLSSDTLGLGTASTIENSLSDGSTSDEVIGTPGFYPVEVFPVCTLRPMPVYPEMASLAGVEGSVIVWVYVGKDGIVQDVQLMHSSGVKSLDDAAMASAQNTGWNCAQNNGIPVGVWTTLQYDFTLSN